MHRGLRAEIDLGAAARNLEAVRAASDSKPIIAAVKADAYGHGAVELSRLYARKGVHSLAVAFLSEALELREAGITLPIIVLFDQDVTDDYFRYDLIPVIHNASVAQAFSSEALRKNCKLGVHLKVDTGMRRMGVLEMEDLSYICSLQGLEIKGLMSHFSEADLADAEYFKLQVRRFKEASAMLESKGLQLLHHVSNSAAVLAYPDARFDAVRPGLVLYGVSPFEPGRMLAQKLSPVMSVKASILTLRKIPRNEPISYGRTFVTRRDSLVAVLAAGYADGYHRAFSNQAQVIVKGVRVPVVGRVCMDLTMVDVTDVPGLSESDEVVLMGRSGAQEITAQELADMAGTIPYEILLWFGGRARRLYRD